MEPILQSLDRDLVTYALGVIAINVLLYFARRNWAIKLAPYTAGAVGALVLIQVTELKQMTAEQASRLLGIVGSVCLGVFGIGSIVRYRRNQRLAASRRGDDPAPGQLVAGVLVTILAAVTLLAVLRG